MNNNTSIIWEEKDSTELAKNSENKNGLETNDIIKNMEIKSEKKECENIGKKWIKKCPDCGITQNYANKNHLKIALRRNAWCKDCQYKHKIKKPIPSEGWIKRCPECNRIINYSSKGCLQTSIDNNSKCKPCTKTIKSPTGGWTRTCSSCNGEIQYKTRNSFIRANRLHCNCEKCAKIVNRKDAAEYFKEANIIHDNAYDYFDYNGRHRFISIKCKHHNKIFKQRASDHLNGHGCPECGCELSRNKRMNTLKQFIEDAGVVHDYLYGYSKVEYKGNKIPVEVICFNHNKSFWVRPDAHIYCKSGCPDCYASKAELKIQSILNKLNIEYKSQKTFNDCRNPLSNKHLKFDFYIPNKNILIEYDGMQHYKTGRFHGYETSKEDLINIQYRDKLKTKYASKNNIKLIRIKYTQFDNIEKILNEKLNL